MNDDPDLVFFYSEPLVEKKRDSKGLDVLLPCDNACRLSTDHEFNRLI